MGSEDIEEAPSPRVVWYLRAVGSRNNWLQSTACHSQSKPGSFLELSNAIPFYCFYKNAFYVTAQDAVEFLSLLGRQRLLKSHTYVCMKTQVLKNKQTARLIPKKKRAAVIIQAWPHQIPTSLHTTNAQWRNKLCCAVSMHEGHLALSKYGTIQDIQGEKPLYILWIAILHTHKKNCLPKV